MDSATPQTDPSKKKTKPNKRQRAKAKLMSERGGTWDLPDESEVRGLPEHVDIQRLADGKDKYVSTLPFKTQEVTVRKRAAILKRTKLQWVWFDKAKELDAESNTRLGTLGYLPREIRDIIFQNVVDNHLAQVIDIEYGMYYDIGLPADGFAYMGKTPLSLRHFHFQSCTKNSWYAFRLGLLDVLDLLWYFPDLMDQPWFDLKLRLASRTIRNQLDWLWLSTSTTEFSCGNAWTEFYTRLASVHRRSIRRIIIQIFSHRSCCNNPSDDSSAEEQQAARTQRWIEAFNKTPWTFFEHLIDVKFHLGEDAHHRPFTEGIDQWRFRQAAVSDYPDVPVTELESVKKTLRILAAAIRQRAPNAQIGGVEEYYLEEDVIAMKAALAGVGGGRREILSLLKSLGKKSRCWRGKLPAKNKIHS